MVERASALEVAKERLGPSARYSVFSVCVTHYVVVMAC
jgi:hypothetical protein